MGVLLFFLSMGYTVATVADIAARSARKAAADPPRQLSGFELAAFLCALAVLAWVLYQADHLGIAPRWEYVPAQIDVGRYLNP